MKKVFLFLCGWILAVLCLVSCGGDDGLETEMTVKVTSVTLSSTELSMTVGDSHTLTATVSPFNATDKTVSWQSSNSSVASVTSSGVVKGVGAGSATITATAGGKSATCVVTVKSQVVEVTGITLSATELSMTVGDSHTLTATVSPSNATDKTVSWQSSNSSIAEVSSSGVVKGIGAGSATITATAGGKSATCVVTVESQVIEVTDITLSVTELSMTVGDSHTLTATVSPSNATDKTVSWQSSNSSCKRMAVTNSHRKFRYRKSYTRNFYNLRLYGHHTNSALATGCSSNGGATSTNALDNARGRNFSDRTV